MYLSNVFCQQNITLFFNAIDSNTQLNLILDSIYIINLSNSSDTTLLENNTSITLPTTLGFDEYVFRPDEGITILQNYPNPFSSSTKVKILINKTSELFLCLRDVSGNDLSKYSGVFGRGIHEFEIFSNVNNLLILSINDGVERKSIKLIGKNMQNSLNKISYSNTVHNISKHSSNLSLSSSFIFNPGDQLKYTAFVEGYIDNEITDSPFQDTTYTFSMTVNDNEPIVITNPIIDITETTATSGGNVIFEGTSSVTSKGVCWNTLPNPTILEEHTVDGTGLGNYTSYLTQII